MTVKPVVLRLLAERDVDEAINYFVSEGSPQSARGFIDAMEYAVAHIARHAATGSLRYAHELSLPGLRFRPLQRYPYLVFYIERDSHVDVWRVLHGSRDIPAWMQQLDEP